MFNRKDKLPRSKIQNQKELGRERRNRAVKREEPLLGIGKSRAESGIKKKTNTRMQAIKAVKSRCIWSGNWRQGAQEFKVILLSVVSSK